MNAMLLDDDPVPAFPPYPAAAVPNAKEGPLAGLTLSVKDIFDVAGYPTGCGQPHVLARSGTKSVTAPLVRELLNAGARFVGKTHTVELAYSLTGRNHHFGTPINPAAPDRLPGGSSSGSAAAVVAAGLCDIGLGSDTGGSVRLPAAYRGLFGIRPTHGRLSLALTMPLAPSFDTPGWLCRDMATLTQVGTVLLGQDIAPLPARSRLLWAEDLFARTAPAAGAALRSALDLVQTALSSARPVRVSGADSEALPTAFRTLQAYEAWQSHGDFIERCQPALGADIAGRFIMARGIARDEAKASQAVKRAFREQFGAMLGRDGVLLLPTTPDIGPLRDATEADLEQHRRQAQRLLCVAGLSGCPQLSLPLAHPADAPLGLSLLGPAGSDRSLMRIASDLMDRLKRL